MFCVCWDVALFHILGTNYMQQLRVDKTIGALSFGVYILSVHTFIITLMEFVNLVSNGRISRFEK